MRMILWRLSILAMICIQCPYGQKAFAFFMPYCLSPSLGTSAFIFPEVSEIELIEDGKLKGGSFIVYSVKGLPGIVAKIIQDDLKSDEIKLLGRAEKMPRLLGDMVVPTKVIYDAEIKINGERKKTHLVLQKRVRSLGELFEQLTAEGNIEHAKKLIIDFFEYQKRIWEMGIEDADPGILSNYTYDEETGKIQVFDLDLVSEDTDPNVDLLFVFFREEGKLIKNADLQRYYFDNMPSPLDFQEIVARRKSVNRNFISIAL